MSDTRNKGKTEPENIKTLQEKTTTEKGNEKEAETIKQGKMKKKDSK